MLLPVFCSGLAVASPGIAKTLDELGGLLSGYAALVAALFAVVKGSQEWSAWQRRKVAEKVAEVAGSVIVAATKLEACMEWLVLFPAIHLRSKATGGGLANLWDVHWHPKCEEAAADFEDALRQGEAYLPDAVVSRAQEYWDVYWDLTHHLERYALAPAGAPPANEDAEHAEQARQLAKQKFVELRSELRRCTLGERQA